MLWHVTLTLGMHTYPTLALSDYQQAQVSLCSVKMIPIYALLYSYRMYMREKQIYGSPPETKPISQVVKVVEGDHIFANCFIISM